MRWTAILAIVLAIAAPHVGSGDVPQTLSYQGVLKRADGNVVPDGDYSITFSLYTVPAGGSGIWVEIQTLTVTGGIFYSMLGKLTTLSLPFDEAYWLGVKVEAEPELTPRIELAASPYAHRASIVDDADRLDGYHGAFYRDASNLNTGVLPESRLPQNAIDASEIENESIVDDDISPSAEIDRHKIYGEAWTHYSDGYPPRCEYAFGEDFLTDSGSYVIVEQTDIWLPTETQGYLFAEASTYAAYYDGAYEGWLGISFSGDLPDPHAARPFAITADSQYQTLSTSLLTAMSSGLHQIYVIAKRDTGPGQVWFPKVTLSVIFIDKKG